MTIMDVEPCGNGSPKVPKFQTIVRSSGSLLISTAWDPESDAESMEQANPSVRVLPPHRQAVEVNMAQHRILTREVSRPSALVQSWPRAPELSSPRAEEGSP